MQSNITLFLIAEFNVLLFFRKSLITEKLCKEVSFFLAVRLKVLMEIILIKFQDSGVRGDLGHPAVCLVALANSFEGENVTLQHLGMGVLHARGLKPMRVLVGPSLALWMVTGHPGNPGVTAGVSDI